MSELKMCPFCGGKAILKEKIECYGHGDYAKEYFVECKSCGVCSKKVCERERFANEKAIEAWNTRKPVENVLEQLEEEVKKCREYRDGKLVYEETAKINGIKEAIEIIKEGL